MDWKSVLGDKFGEKLLDGMSQLAHGIGVASEHLYTILVKQQVTVGIAYLVGALLGFIIMTIGLRIMCKHASNIGWENVDELWVGIILLPIVVCAFCIPMMIFGFMHVFNPEYYAIKEIMNTISGNSK